MISSCNLLSLGELNNLSPITLAFVGDAVFTLCVRQRLATEHGYSTGTLQKMCAEKVSARGQNEFLAKIYDILSENEKAVFKRGRNAKKPTRSKSATLTEYNNSTGLEAIFGHLYLKGDYERIKELLSYL